MSSSFLSVLIQRQAGKYGDRVALRYRDYKTETWIPVSWNQFAATVKTVSTSVIPKKASCVKKTLAFLFFCLLFTILDIKVNIIKIRIL